MLTSSPRLTSIVLRIALAVALALLVLGAIAVTSPAAAPHDPSQPKPSESPVAVIPPGREADVMSLVSELGKSFAGWSLGHVQIDKSEIRIALQPRERDVVRACKGPAWLAPPGGLRLTLHELGAARDQATGERSAGPLTLAWWLCDEAADPAAADREAARALPRMVSAGGGRAISRIWVSPEASGVVMAPGRPNVPRSIVTPLAAFTRNVPPDQIVSALWLACAVIALGAPYLLRRPKSIDPEPSRASASPRERRIAAWVAVALVVAGSLLRIVIAWRRPLDGDEQWAFPSRQSIFAGDHDPSVHPPLFRLLAEVYGRFVGWSHGDSQLALRLPWACAAIAALIVIVCAIHRLARGRLAPLLAALVVALSPIVGDDGVLARPYGLASAAVAVVLMALFVAGPSPKLRFQAALAALAVALWVDLIAGLAGALVIAAYLVFGGVGWRARIVIGVAVAMIVAPLLPGALVAIRTGVHPPPVAPGMDTVDLRPMLGLGHGRASSAALSLAAFAAISIADPGTLVLVLVVVWWLFCLLATPRKSQAPVFALFAILIALVALSTQIGMRTRNVSFLPFLGAVVSAVALASIRRVRALADRALTSDGRPGRQPGGAAAASASPPSRGSA